MTVSESTDSSTELAERFVLHRALKGGRSESSQPPSHTIMITIAVMHFTILLPPSGHPFLVALVPSCRRGKLEHTPLLRLLGFALAKLVASTPLISFKVFQHISQSLLCCSANRLIDLCGMEGQGTSGRH